MTDHIFGKGSYVECTDFTVVNVTRYEDYDRKFRPEHVCYCGNRCVQMAQVGFHHYQEEPHGDELWPRSITENVKVHRCEKHKFDLP